MKKMITINEKKRLLLMKKLLLLMKVRVNVLMCFIDICNYE